MIQFGRYNNIPEEVLQKHVPRVKRGKKVAFSVYSNGTKNGSPRLPAALGVPQIDRIVIDGVSYQIANITAIQPGENGETAVMDSPFFYKDQAGQMILDPNGSARDRDLYEYLCLSNYNGTNPNRDESKPKKYFLVDAQKEAREKTQKVMERSMAINAVYNMSSKDLRSYAGMVGIRTENRDDDVVRADAIERAERDPKKFHEISVYLKQMGPYVNDVNAAIEAGVIFLDTTKHVWKWKDSGQEFYTGFSNMSRVDNIKRLAEWFRNEKDGKNTHMAITEALRPTEEEAEPEPPAKAGRAKKG